MTWFWVADRRGGWVSFSLGDPSAAEPPTHLRWCARSSLTLQRPVLLGRNARRVRGAPATDDVVVLRPPCNVVGDAPCERATWSRWRWPRARATIGRAIFIILDCSLPMTNNSANPPAPVPLVQHPPAIPVVAVSTLVPHTPIIFSDDDSRSDRYGSLPPTPISFTLGTFKDARRR